MLDQVFNLISAITAIFFTTYITNKLIGNYQQEWLEKKYGKKLRASNFGIPFTRVGFVVFILILAMTLTLFEWLLTLGSALF